MLSLKLLYNSPLSTLVKGWRKKRKKVDAVTPALEDSTLENDPLRKEYVQSIPEAQLYRGVLLQGYLVPPDVLEGLDDMEIREDDVFVITYPKSGTTWTEEIVSLIYKGGDVRKVEKELLIYRVHHLEVGRPFGHQRFLRKLKSPRLMATHLPLPLIPKQLKQPKCKIIYVMRNPKDTAVSYYHHHKMSTFLGNTTDTWDKFFEHFRAGHLVYGSWFDHVLPYWEFCKQNPNNVFFMTYEELKMDLRGMVLRLCDFLERPLSPEAVDAIVRHCTFESMKTNKMVNREVLPITDLFDMTKSKFMRKGIIGDWKNYFTEEQTEAFNRLCESRMSQSDLQLVFEPEDADNLFKSFGRIIHNHPERIETELAQEATEDDEESGPKYYEPWNSPLQAFFQVYLQSDPLTLYADD
ncbi:Sulfotransferase family cytosolic 1B member 1 [Araneus ventricosus]|uniref:Sulfotransferase family cytosolic 1B member 1 n=1 Tax=Araneus ventricosus TaxID=182803 RepID=A0A4Y2CZU1_ARAVE|nr:Sulfotransferase family cytosolic 1B member 1 [Araneus ventricosus]